MKESAFLPSHSEAGWHPIVSVLHILSVTRSPVLASQVGVMEVLPQGTDQDAFHTGEDGAL